MRSVPPRGSGWLPVIAIANCRLRAGDKTNWQLEIVNGDSPATEAVKKNINQPRINADNADNDPNRLLESLLF